MNEEQDPFISFGTPLEPLDEDELPSKRPIQVQDQKVYDENGLQRFHGAFTGGFSAGYFNTVGTKEGWQPSEFVSSRTQKATKNIRRPEDFMDAEDLREFGIAPVRIHAKEQFRKEGNHSSREINRVPQVIPGAAPLLDIVRPVAKSIGVVLLQKLGWRPGKGIGPKTLINLNQKVYGCALPPSVTGMLNEQDSSTSILVSPSDVNVLPYKAKDNVYGLGYVSLHTEDFSISMIADSVSGHVNVGKGKKKVAFSGQAFGVGAFEDDDEDVYGRDDLSKYDFSLEDEKDLQKQAQSRNSKKSSVGDSSLSGFVMSSQTCTFNKKHFPPPVLPAGFVPKNVIVSTTPATATSTGTGRFLNRFAFSAVDRKKMLGNRFADSSTKQPDVKHDKTSKEPDAKGSLSLDTSVVDKQEEKNPEAPLKFPTILSSKFVPSSTLEVEELSYGLSRPTTSLISTEHKKENKAMTSEPKCQRLIEIWHPLALLCKRFNVPDPYPGLEEPSLAAMSSRPARKPSIFRSLFEAPVVMKQPDSEIPDLPKDEPMLDNSHSDAHIDRGNETTSNLPLGDPQHTSTGFRDKSQQEDEIKSSLSSTPAPEEDYKPPTPPSMDLFKEIFQDSSSDEENVASEHSEDEAKPESKHHSVTSKADNMELLQSSSDTVSSSLACISNTSEKDLTKPDLSLYGPALPPVGIIPVLATTKVSLESYQTNKRKAKKKKSHHKSHKKHKKKKSRHSKHSSDESAEEKGSGHNSSSDEEGNDVDVNFRLIKRLKEMKKGSK